MWDFYNEYRFHAHTSLKSFHEKICGFVEKGKRSSFADWNDHPRKLKGVCRIDAGRLPNIISKKF